MLEAEVALKKMHAALFLLIIAALTAGIAHGSQTLREVHASDVLEKIARGEEINYDRAIITGNLDLGDLNLSRDDFGRRVIASKICINSSLINGDVDFDNLKFMRKIDFGGTTFRGNVSFSGSHFVSIASFRNASFLKQADFTYAEFENLFDLSKAVFSKDALFDHSEIYEFGNLSFASFKGHASFKDVVFSSYAFLNGAQFDNGVSFYRAEFHRETRFFNARFLGYINFNDSRFSDYAYFTGDEFQGPISLNNSKIPDWMVDWSSIEGHLIYNEDAYQALLQRLWNLGNFDGYDNCYYQYRWQKQSYEPLGIPKAVDIFAWISCGYGVRPLRTLALGFMMIILFGIIYWKAKLVPRFHGAKLDDSHKREDSMISAMWDAMYFSTMMFVTRPPYGLYPVGRWRYLIVLEYISGWLIMALFLVVMARLMIR